MKRILVVEDEASIRELVALNLKMTGWEVLEAPSAERALELIQKNPPCDVALLDIMLPGMDGFSLCETIRHGDPYIGIIMASAKGQESDKIRGLSIGADDYITKPFNPLELLARVRALLRRSGGQAAPTEYAVGPLYVSPARHVVRVNGRDVTLTLKEYEVLKMLLENLDVVLTRDQLLNRIWGYSFDGESRTVDVHIRTLRQKLAEAGELIETVRGVGYKIGAQS